MCRKANRARLRLDIAGIIANYDQANAMKALARRQLTFKNRIILTSTDNLERHYLAVRQCLVLPV